jgi:hypothetical protein
MGVSAANQDKVLVESPELLLCVTIGQYAIRRNCIPLFMNRLEVFAVISSISIDTRIVMTNPSATTEDSTIAPRSSSRNLDCRENPPMSPVSATSSERIL